MMPPLQGTFPRENGSTEALVVVGKLLSRESLAGVRETTARLALPLPGVLPTLLLSASLPAQPPPPPPSQQQESAEGQYLTPSGIT